MGVFIVLVKAFDTVDHNILLNILQNYGVRGICLKLLKSYLEGRQQYVSFNGVYSDTCGVSHGVPHGSVLGPLLFLVYIDDIKYCSNILHLVLFADDTNLFLMSNNLNFLITSVNMELDKLLNLALESEKAFLFHFGFRSAGKQIVVMIEIGRAHV